MAAADSPEALGSEPAAAAFGGQDSLGRPPGGETVQDGPARDAGELTPPVGSFGAALERDEPGVAAVLHLLGPGRPAAVLGGVRAVVVDAVDGVTRTRAASDVGEEVR